MATNESGFTKQTLLINAVFMMVENTPSGSVPRLLSWGHKTKEVYTIFVLIKVFWELQGVTDCDIVLEVTLGTVVYVLEVMKGSFRITGNMNFAWNEMCPT